MSPQPNDTQPNDTQPNESRPLEPHSVYIARLVAPLLGVGWTHVVDPIRISASVGVLRHTDGRELVIRREKKRLWVSGIYPRDHYPSDRERTDAGRPSDAISVVESSNP